MAQLLEALSYEPEGRGFPMESLKIFIDNNTSHSTGVDSVRNRNGCQEYFLGCKGGQCVGLTILSSLCVDCLKILRVFNFLEASWPVQTLLVLFYLFD